MSTHQQSTETVVETTTGYIRYSTPIKFKNFWNNVSALKFGNRVTKETADAVMRAVKTHT
jgi:hypothetical protein